MGSHLGPIVDPNTANFMGDPWIRQCFNPSANETFLPAKIDCGKLKSIDRSPQGQNGILYEMEAWYLSGAKDRYLSPGCLKLFSFSITH